MLLIRKRIAVTIFSLFIVGLSLLASTKNVDDIPQVDVATLVAEDDGFMTDFNIDDLDQLRSFDETCEPIDMTLKEKIELLMIILSLKTRSYHNEFLEHLSQHGNEYLIGSTCIAAMVVMALLKNYINTSTIPTNAS